MNGLKNINFGETIDLISCNVNVKSTMFILNMSNDKVLIVSDPYNKVEKLYFHKIVTKNDINISIHDSIRTITINNIVIDTKVPKVDFRTQRFELETASRTFSLKSYNGVTGIGKQKFGIGASDVFDFFVDKDSYFIANKKSYQIP